MAKDGEPPDDDLFGWSERFGSPTRPESKLEAEFWEFHADNPHVYRLFNRFTWQLVRAGRTHFSSDAILHTIRFYTAVETTDPDFKINNNYSAYYARLWMRDNPEHEGFFETRRTRGGVSKKLSPA